MRHYFAAGLATIAGLFICVDAATAVQTLSGQTASGAYYQIQVPDGWQPGGPLVLFQHGLSFDPPAPNPDLGPLAALQLSEGYAVAATSYSQRSWALFNAPDDNAQLLDAFKQQVGAPGTIIPWGGSLGGLISLKLAEDVRFAPVPGVLSLCPPAAGSRVWDFGIDARLAYDVVCKDVNSAGQLPKGKAPLTWAYNLSDIPSDLSDLEDQAELVRTLLPVNVCTGVNLPPVLQNDAMVRRLNQMKDFAHITSDKFFLTDMGYATYGLSDLVRAPDKLGGLNPFTTTGVVYSDPAINAGIARIDADRFAQLYLRWASDFRGRVDPSTKVISLQTSQDQLVIPANQSVLRANLPAVQLTSAIVNEATPTHCGFTTAEGVGAWEALRAWIAGGAQPTIAGIQGACQNAVSGGSAGPCRVDASIVPPSFDSQVAPRPASTAPNVDARWSGMWYDPARSGEGIELEILPGAKAMVTYFTYPPAGGTGRQAWLLGVGDVVGNGIEFADVLLPTRDAQGKVNSQHWGRIALSFDNCGSGGMRWDGPANWGSMEVPLVKLAELDGLGCGSSATTFSQVSGAWYDPATTGNGFLLERTNANTLQVMYFQQNTDGTQSWLVGSATTDGQGGYSAALSEPSGTQFGSGFDATKIAKPVNYDVTMQLGCASGTATLTARNGGGVQTFALRRLTVPAGIAACPS
ncbi:MAG: hypothetical protein J0I77_14105 [Rudaea sp.]|uniref:hypothetical protein n=1 Tax=unclassified Rudaea TaxID=2627037 RepID=UPI0010F5C340|nr:MULTISPECIES: hypothetical protein [unclassified Rudaea]MBN8886849.1 hypothetical protein [Rudaea sp.]MBR0347483.1 hypothetical protein [Rudaea sp.]